MRRPGRWLRPRAGTPITVGSLPDAIAITPDGTTAYVVNDNSGTVTPIATATNTASHPITVGSLPVSIAIAATPPAAASHEIKGYDGKCADDSGNSSAVRRQGTDLVLRQRALPSNGHSRAVS